VEKTRSIDFSKLTLRDALDLATLVEEEAKDRYQEFADQMDMHHNPEAARFFKFMLANEAKHENKLAERRRTLFGSEPRTVTREMIFDIEAPEYDEARTFMTVRQAMAASLRSEEKAHGFFMLAVQKVTDEETRSLFAELCAEEREHVMLVKKELDKAPPDPALKAEDFSDDPVQQ
jgi:rubrerythrin